MMSGPVALPRTDHRELVASTVVPKRRVGLSEVGVERQESCRPRKATCEPPNAASRAVRDPSSSPGRRGANSCPAGAGRGEPRSVPVRPFPRLGHTGGWRGDATRGGRLARLVVPSARAATYFVRQTVGDDSNDGLTPATAWKHFSRLAGHERRRHGLRRPRPLSRAGLGRARWNPRGTPHLHCGHDRPAHRRSARRGHGGGLRARGRQDIRPLRAAGGLRAHFADWKVWERSRWTAPSSATRTS